MLAPQRSGAPTVPLAVVVRAQKLASGSPTCGRGDNIWPVSSLGAESWWAHGELDYMHARYCSPITGRFLGVDRGRSAEPQTPQTWNRYTYALGNPLNIVDPDGMVGYLSHEQAAKNAAKRQAMREKLSSIPLIGRPLAALADATIGGFYPTSTREMGEGIVASNSMPIGAGVLSVGGGRIGSLGLTLGNIFKNNLTTETAIAAGIESKGGVVAVKASGQAFDHVRKFDTARKGVTAALESLKNAASDSRLLDSERAFARYLLSKYSKALDEIETVLTRAANSTPPPTP